MQSTINVYTRSTSLTHKKTGPPACTDFKTTLENIRTVLDKIPPPSPTIFITGDFNFPTINWANDTINGGTSADKSQARLLLTFIEDYCLTQIIHSPTRLNNILDLFLTNEHIIHDHETYHTNLSDHNLTTVTTSIDTKGLTEPARVSRAPVPDFTFSYLNFYNKNVDWDALRAQIAAIDWLSLLTPKSVDAQHDTILSLLLEACITHVPRRSSGSNTTTIPRDRRALMRTRTRLRKKSATNQHDRDLINAKIDRINTALVNSVSNELHLKEAKAVASIKTNPKFFYKYAFTKLKTHTPVSPLTVNDNIITNPQAISNIIKDQYKTVFSTLLPSKVIHDKTSFSNSPIEREEQLLDVNITSHNITNAIKTLKTNSAADDTRTSRTINNQDDAVLLQKDIDTIYKWAAMNNMAFNHTKFEHLTYNTNPSDQPTTSYTAPDGSPITNPSKVQDLGVCFSSDATFSAHIATTAKKAHSQLEA
ncbi:hypothetical protein Pcinc_030186 [Petrolisthes cinctipes]|uniref:Endonuclease/exonuclease/phosphatase domain-containing protein n=1 Tax=Petrolisthes cinctipes TaxID=88211 RepID=A0AAE1EYW1_PETCI|nr:hypothetical protein Pcinc_030186 [Petrolisthes cinctipes]